MGMRDYLEEKTEELNFVEGQEKYRLLMEYGEKLTESPERTDDNRVPGCTSGVFIDAHLEDDKVYFRGCSDSVIVRGYLAILIEAMSGLTPEKVINEVDETIEEFVESTDIKAHLTPSRANAFGNIIEFMKKKAASI